MGFGYWNQVLVTLTPCLNNTFSTVTPPDKCISNSFNVLFYSHIQYWRHTKNRKRWNVSLQFGKEIFQMNFHCFVCLSDSHLATYFSFSLFKLYWQYLAEKTNVIQKIFVIEMWIHLFCIGAPITKQFKRKISLWFL